MLDTATTTFLLVMLGFVAIGALSMRRKAASVDDYLTASSQVPAWLVGLSAVATNNSGYMFIGLIGFTFVEGISSAWLAFGWLTGDLLAWFTIHPAVRRFSEKNPVNTVPALIAHRGERAGGSVRILAGVLIIAFLAVYAAAQLMAGSKVLNVVFHWPEWLGVIGGAAVVLLYSFAGGLRASIWTDAAQSFVMLFGMLALLAAGVSDVGGPITLWHSLASIDPALVTLIPSGLSFGLPLFVLGWIAAGLGVAGQPHLVVRTLALQSPEQIPRARRVYFAWYLPFVTMTVLVGLYARALFDGTATLVDPELALPLMAQAYLPDIGVGIVLAAVVAAAMSTADSMLLSTSAAVSQDIFHRFGQSYVRTKIGTALVTVGVVFIAIAAPANVFDLVILAWSGLGATLGPPLAVRVLGWPLGYPAAFGMILAGLAGVVGWRLLGLQAAVYEILPGFVCAATVYGGARLFDSLWSRAGRAHPVARSPT
ncbi:MAG: sodium/proline symporter [Pseudomonadales bacterium]